MNTTLLFAEILIVGLQSGVWLIFLLFSVLGIDWFQNISALLKDWQTVLLAILIPLLYVMGIIIDRFSDRIFENWNERTKKSVMGNEQLSLTIMRFALGKDNEFLNQQIEYTRTKMRIARAS